MEVGSLFGGAGWGGLIHPFIHLPDSHILCTGRNARHGEDSNEQDTIMLQQDPFSKHNVVVWNSEWLGRWATIQSMRRRAWPAKRKSAGIQGRISFSEGIMVQDRKLRQTLSPRLNKHSGVEGRDYHLMNRRPAQAPGRRVMRETHFRPHPPRNGPVGWRASLAGWDLAQMNQHWAFFKGQTSYGVSQTVHFSAYFQQLALFLKLSHFLCSKIKLPWMLRMKSRLFTSPNKVKIMILFLVYSLYWINIPSIIRCKWVFKLYLKFVSLKLEFGHVFMIQVCQISWKLKVKSFKLFVDLWQNSSQIKIFRLSIRIIPFSE